MKDETQINAWLDQWEEWQEAHPGSPLYQFAQVCLASVPDEARNEFLRVAEKLKRVDREIRRQVGSSDTQSAVQQDTRLPGKRNTRSSGLQPGTEPIPGYRLETCLGRGGFGEVWRAFAPGGVPIALKFVRLGMQFGDREQRALELLKSIRHPHLLGFSGSWEKDGWLIMALELADRTLADRLEEANKQGLSGIPANELLRYMAEAAEGLDFLNEPSHPTGDGKLGGVQHRDVKPQNLLLVGRSLKVGDFGLARLLVDQTAISHTGGMTPKYAAPEFYSGKTSSHSDQYSLGITYCHLRGGRLPFTGESPELMLGHISKQPDLSMLPIEEQAIVAKALAKAPHDRWPSCSDFVEALRRANAGGIAIQTRLSRKKPTIKRRLRRFVTSACIAGVPAILLLIVTFIAARGYKDHAANTSLPFPNDALEPASTSQQVPLDPGPPPALKPLPRVAGMPEMFDFANGPRPAKEAQAAQAAWAKYLNRPVEGQNGVGITLVLIPPGRFLMGSPSSEIGHHLRGCQTTEKWNAPRQWHEICATDDRLLFLSQGALSWQMRECRS
ncbi:MAG: serine/threonine-protein kinase, partial [Pirellulales bacterium]